ncbi:hypothetical protein ACMWP0_05380 [Helicobacter pylori]|uniref:hypothetical protein n=1 Tax=Helicobacter pylori TaxID=210 RepID=UPI0039E0639C
MYAITFDLDTNCLNENAVNLSKVYSDIRKFMEQYGFKWQQGSVYFGDETINAVTCVATVQILAKKFAFSLFLSLVSHFIFSPPYKPTPI